MAYNLANPEKDNWWNNMLRKIGEEPVLFDVSATEKSVDNLKIYLDSRGYFASQVDYQLDTISRPKRAKVTYSFKQGEPYIIDKISYDFKDRFLEPILLPDSVNRLVHTGDIFNIAVLDAERERIASMLKNRGYYNFSVNNISYIADTLKRSKKVALTMIIKQKLTGYTSRGEAIYDNNAVYRLRNIEILPGYDAVKDKADRGYMFSFDSVNYKGLDVLYDGKRPYMRPEVLRPQLPLYSGAIYDHSYVQRTYNNLMQMGFKSARINFAEVPDSLSKENKTYLTYVGGTDSILLNYTREQYLDCRILCTPSLKQSIKAELEGSTTSSFYGLKASLGYQNRNVFRGAELLDITGMVGYEYMKAPDALRRSAIELGLTAGLSFPQFLFLHTSGLSRISAPKTRFEISYNYQNRPYYRRDLSSAVWSYSWRNASNSSFVFRPISINWVNVGYIDQDYFNSLQNEYLKRSYESQLIVGLSGTYTYNNPRAETSLNQTLFRANVELAGNTVDGLMHLFSKPVAGQNYYNFLGIRYSQYFRADINASQRIMLGERCAIAGRIYAGFGVAYGNSQAIPFDRMFYAGGSNSMRGWAPRTLGPGSSPIPENVVYPTQLGDTKLEANIEFRFPIWSIFHGATFFDVGNVWYMGRNGVEYPENSVFHFNEFYKQLGFNTGIGIRLDITFAVLRLDWGIQLHNPNRPAGERWIHDFKWKNTSLNFGVGYPF
jgi:outer membrane protein assembly factor BamA